MGGEAWNVQKGKRAKRVGLSLSDWLEQNGYPKATVSSVFNGSFPAKKLEFLKKDRREASGPDGNLSRAQRLRILGDAGGAKPQPKKGAKPTAVGEEKAEQSAAALRRMKAQIAQLTAQLAAKASPTTPTAIITEVGGNMDVEAGGNQNLAEAEVGKRARLCFACGSDQHLKASCPLWLKLQRTDRVLKVLRDDPSDDAEKAAEIAARSAARDALAAQLTAAKESTLPLDRLLAMRKAEVAKAQAALTEVDGKLGKAQAKVNDLLVEVDKLQQQREDALLGVRRAEAAEAAVSVLPPPSAQPDQQAARSPLMDARFASAAAEVLKQVASAYQPVKDEEVAKAY